MAHHPKHQSPLPGSFQMERGNGHFTILSVCNHRSMEHASVDAAIELLNLTCTVTWVTWSFSHPCPLAGRALIACTQ